MRGFQLSLVSALAAWATTAAAVPNPLSSSRGLAAAAEDGTCSPNLAGLGQVLSADSEIYCPDSAEFGPLTLRWSLLGLPTVSAVVVPATEKDVSETIKFANEKDVPFLAYNGFHGATVSLEAMKDGISINLAKLADVKVSADGQTAQILGGTNSKVVTDTLWAAGKQTVTGTCECVSYMGPALGGGHGWLQGHHGLLADQWVSMNVVLADGSIETIDGEHELMWAMKGAGHNFGIVTSVTVKVYDIEHSNWAIETLTFRGDQVEDVYRVTNEVLMNGGDQPVDVIHWSYWLNNPEADPVNPVIVFYLIQEGVDAIDSKYAQPLRDIGPISAEPLSGTYRNLSAWTGIALDSPPCQKLGSANPRFPIYLDGFDVPAMKATYDLYAAAVGGDSPFGHSIFMFEAYSTQGVKAVNSASTAFAFRGENILAAPLIIYVPDGPALDSQVEDLGNQLRDTLHKATGRTEYRAYVNYAYGNEKNKNLYGDEQWRQCKLQALKKTYDPENKFSFYNPIRV